MSRTLVWVAVECVHGINVRPYAGRAGQLSALNAARYPETVRKRSRRSCARPPCERLTLEVAPLRAATSKPCTKPPCSRLNFELNQSTTGVWQMDHGKTVFYEDGRDPCLPASQAAGSTVVSIPGNRPSAIKLNRATTVAVSDPATTSLPPPPAYRIVKPNMTKWQALKNTLFYHADPAGVPYADTDFAAAFLARNLSLDVVRAYGVFEFAHFWYFFFESLEAKMRYKTTGDLCVKGKRCITFDPDCSEVQLKIMWLPAEVTASEISAAFASFGKVTGVKNERPPSPFKNAVSTVRIVTLSLRDGALADRVPNFVKIAGFNASVSVIARNRVYRNAELCLRTEEQASLSSIEETEMEPYEFMLDERSWNVTLTPVPPLREVLWPTESPKKKTIPAMPGSRVSPTVALRTD
ncbi:hypothetical protein BIW11_12464 [Tropilaelaps mercedesae]|uniref:Uncharacterized protein n=1 Tax=Tropilaelaps mercedesae TaxID=418985 RepID=A0A1V9X6J0_9ACAR|nr:hypothetical protein BIW11_12464 [Tropilaelaps mercedesae]